MQARFAMDNTEEKLSQAECGRLGGYRAVTSKSMLLVLCSQLKLIRDIPTAEKVLQLPSKIMAAAK